MRRLCIALLLCVPSVASAQSYRFPMELPSSGTQPYVTAYRDHDSSSGLQDWNCGTDTYDGHKGSDFGIGSWPVMDAGSRWAVAAADGTVAFVNDGCFDHCSTGDCGCGSGFGNYVKINHADGKSTYYGHLMNGSLVVAVGDQVKCGQHLGKVGSSGNSTGPHLHFEPRYPDNTSDDSFSGPCAGPTSFWVDQGAYQALPGDQCENPTPPDVDDAKLSSETPGGPSQVAPGQSFDKTWVLENSGNTTWSQAGGYALVTLGGDDFGAPAQSALGSAESIAPTEQKTWTLSLVAPATTGTYSADFRMDHAGVAPFGPTLHLEVVVSPPDSGASGGTGGLSSGGGGIIAKDAGAGAGSAQSTRVLSDVEGGCGCRSSEPEPARAGLAILVMGLGLCGLRRARRGSKH